MNGSSTNRHTGSDPNRWDSAPADPGEAPVPLTAAVVLAAGRGRRFGRPKQFERIGGVTLVDRVVTTAQAVCGYVILVLPTDYVAEHDGQDHPWGNASPHAVVRGGGSHGESAWIGLQLVPESVDIVVLASASHPLAGPNLFHRTIQAVAAGAHASAPLGLVADAVKRLDGGRVVGSIPKADVALAQSPCAFDRATLVRAYERFRAEKRPLPPEELEMIEQLGGTIVLVEGEPTNIHVTTPLDLEIARRLLDLVPDAVTVGRPVSGSAKQAAAGRSEGAPNRP
ncbi:MAG: 2-C-methyl-D-erythritol 4-phosphate cytidylyltransferase [Acidimicrobiia bacterium]|nr:2-C-methyl-D-erythritol 4-phosphate cytidylyltransferase [Acidimicrobiia bacterium]